MLFGRQQLVALPLLTHLEYLDFADVVVIVKVVFGSINAFGFILDKGDCPRDYLIIFVFVVLSCLLSDLFYPLDETVVVTIGIECDNSHPSVDFDHFFPVWHLPRPIELHCLEFIGITVFSLQFVASVLVEIAYLFYPQLFVVLHHYPITS